MAESGPRPLIPALEDLDPLAIGAAVRDCTRHALQQVGAEVSLKTCNSTHASKWVFTVGRFNPEAVRVSTRYDYMYMSELDPRLVTAFRNNSANYPDVVPFHPSEAYPEYTGPVSSTRNTVYEMVRDCFRLAGLDAARFGSAEWNPLGDVIRPGECVLLKPNLVKEKHPRDPDGWRYVVTHGSVIRAVADYVLIAVGSKGRIVIADAPQTDSNFETLVANTGISGVAEYFRSRGVEVDVYDLRREEWIERDGVIVARRAIGGDPNGGIAFDLGQASEFVGHRGAGSYYGADYDAGEVNRHHTGGRHEYMIAASAITCDVVFSIPKLKTHKKAGITVSLKNLVGVNGDKNWLPHHTEGAPEAGGDEHPQPDAKHRAERMIIPYVRKLSLKVPVVGPLVHRMARRVGRNVFGDTEVVVRSGNWHGNDTVWRMCMDLNKLILYGNPDGTLRPPGESSRKRHLVLVDGVIAGEGRGPMNPDPVAAGVVVFGVHPASVDAACCWLMGFDPDRVPIVRQAFRCRAFSLAEWDWRDVSVRSNVAPWNGLLVNIPDDSTMHFVPHFGWLGRIERRATTDAAS